MSPTAMISMNNTKTLYKLRSYFQGYEAPIEMPTNIVELVFTYAFVLSSPALFFLIIIIFHFHDSKTFLLNDLSFSHLHYYTLQYTASVLASSFCGIAVFRLSSTIELWIGNLTDLIYLKHLTPIFAVILAAWMYITSFFKLKNLDLEADISMLKRRGLGYKSLLLWYSKYSKTDPSHRCIDTWFDLVAYSSDSKNSARSYHEEHRWLEGFFLPPNIESYGDISREFRDAGVEFELAPTKFINHIEKFSRLLRIRDMWKALLMSLGLELDGKERKSRLELLVFLQTEIHSIMQSDQSPSLDRFKQMFNCDNDFEAAANEIHWSLQLIEFYAKSRSPAIDQLQTLLKQLGDSNESKLTKRIETSWQEEHRRRLRHLFNEINQRENNEKRAILRDLSTQLIDLSNDSKPLSAEHDKFQSNICLFVEARTSQEGLRYSEAIQKLREMSFIKNEQSKVLYEAFSKQQAEIALQQRIITCLEYRHILERLPNKKHLLSLRSGKSATATWQTTWNLAIQTELESMIKAYLLRSDSDSEETYELSSSVPPDDQEIRLSPLRLLIQRDFDDWVAQPGSWELEDVNSEQSKSISDESIGSSGKEPKNHVEKTDDLNKGREESKASVEKTDDPKKGPEGSSDSEKPQEHSFPLVQKYQPPYKNWGVYQRGLTLYADLSSNIHNYGRSYKVDRHSWSRSDGLTFDWLKPKINKHGEVDWQEEWIRKGLPQVKKIKKEQPVPQHNILDDDENENENNIYDGTRWLER